MAIGIKVNKAVKGYDYGASRFFGDPAIPGAWINDFYDSEIFFCQLRCSDIAPFDREGVLPHSGYIYVFLDIGTAPYKARVLYYDGKPDTVVDNFNGEADELFTQSWTMNFFLTDEAAEGNKLLGTPADWQYGGEKPRVFLQYDPLDAPMGFLGAMDGFAYFLFEERSSSFEHVVYVEEYS